MNAENHKTSGSCTLETQLQILGTKYPSPVHISQKYSEQLVVIPIHYLTITGFCTHNCKMSAQAATENYDYLRRRGSTMSAQQSHTPGSVSPRRKPVRNQSARTSNGTVSTATSTSNKSAETNMTQPPSYSKKFVVVGDGGCGKTCLLISYSQGYFPEVNASTSTTHYSHLIPSRNMFLPSSKTTLHIRFMLRQARPLNLLSGIRQGKKSTIDFDHSPTQKPTFSSFALPLTAQTPWRT